MSATELLEKIDPKTVPKVPFQDKIIYARIEEIYDGDTVKIIVLFGETPVKLSLRILGIDTPEIKGQCASELALALRAKEFTQSFLKGGHVEIRQTGIDKYGRVLATIRRGDQDLGDALIAEGLARPWRGTREQWCNAK